MPSAPNSQLATATTCPTGYRVEENEPRKRKSCRNRLAGRDRKHSTCRWHLTDPLNGQVIPITPHELLLEVARCKISGYVECF